MAAQSPRVHSGVGLIAESSMKHGQDARSKKHLKHCVRRARQRQQMHALLSLTRRQAAVLKAVGSHNNRGELRVAEEVGEGGIVDGKLFPNQTAELADRLQNVAVCLDAQLTAANHGKDARSSKDLVSRAEHLTNNAAKHNFEEEMKNIALADVRRWQKRKAMGQNGDNGAEIFRSEFKEMAQNAWHEHAPTLLSDETMDAPAVRKSSSPGDGLRFGDESLCQAVDEAEVPAGANIGAELGGRTSCHDFCTFCPGCGLFVVLDNGRGKTSSFQFRTDAPPFKPSGMIDCLATAENWNAFKPLTSWKHEYEILNYPSDPVEKKVEYEPGVKNHIQLPPTGGNDVEYHLNQAALLYPVLGHGLALDSWKQLFWIKRLQTFEDHEDFTNRIQRNEEEAQQPVVQRPSVEADDLRFGDESGLYQGEIEEPAAANDEPAPHMTKRQRKAFAIAEAKRQKQQRRRRAARTEGDAPETTGEAIETCMAEKVLTLAEMTRLAAKGQAAAQKCKRARKAAGHDDEPVLQICRFVGVEGEEEEEQQQQVQEEAPMTKSKRKRENNKNKLKKEEETCVLS